PRESQACQSRVENTGRTKLNMCSIEHATRRDRAVVIGLVVLVVAVGIPYAVMGPKIILDDWFTIDWRSRLGLLHTSDQLHSRPGAWLTFVGEFGLIGRHPLAIHLVQVALSAAIAV